MTYYFLKEDYDDFLKEFEMAESNVQKALKEIGESAKQDPGNTFHDNFGFEEGNRQFMIWSVELEKLNAIKTQSEIISPKPADTAEIGKSVKIEDLETKKTFSFQIRGFMVQPKENAISYLSPLGKLIMGSKPGAVKTGKIGEKIKRYKIVEIS